MKKRPKDVVGYVQIGMIVGQVNIIETNINWILADYYTGVNDSSALNIRLQTDVLGGGMIRLDDKLKLLRKVATAKGVGYTKKIENDLLQWKEIRNIVAHGLPTHHSDGGIFILSGGTHHDINKLRTGFGRRQDRITNFLKQLLPDANKGS